MKRPLARLTSVACLTLVLGACISQESNRMMDSDRPGRPIRAALTSDPAQQSVAGCWKLVQGSYRGVLSLRQSGAAVEGFMDWDNHVDAIVAGTMQGTTLDVTFDYFTPPKHNLSGNYRARLAADGKSFQSLTSVAFTGTSQACIEQSGCWAIKQEQYTGTLNLVWKTGGYANGYMDWDNHEFDAAVAGRVANGRVDMTFTYLPQDPLQPPLSLKGGYTAALSGDKLQFQDGLTWDTQFPDDKRPWSGVSVPCKDIAGCFRVEQRNADGAHYTGLWRLAPSPAPDTALNGTADWDNHEDGVMAGSLVARKFSLEMTFPGTPKEGLTGFYQAVIDPAGDAFSGATGTLSTYTGMRALCPVP